jgi:hypothetical protein
MAVNLSPVGGAAAQFFNNDGVPLAGGKIATYLAGTTTPAATYTTSAGSIAHSNPIILDSSGRVPTGEIWVTNNTSYKFILYDLNDVLIGSYDNLVGINDVNAANVTYTPNANSLFTATTVAGALDQVSNKQSGSSYVGFLADGTNAIATNLQTKLREYVSVFDFMTPAQIADVQARTYTLDTINAIDAAIAASPDVYFPPGGYLISRAIALTGNTTNGRHLYGSQNFNTVIKRTTTNSQVINTRTVTCVMYVGGLDHIIENFYVVGVTGSVDGVVIDCARTTISDVWSDNSRRAFYAFQPYICIFDRLIAKNASETAFDFATAGVFGKTSLAFTNCGIENCGNGFLMADVVYSSMTACFADYVNRPMPGNPYGVGYGSRASSYGVYSFNKCDITLNGCGVENSSGNGIISLGADGGNSVVVNSMTAFLVDSTYVPTTEWATYPNWAVGPIQTGNNPNSLQINGGRWNWQNTVVPVSYPTKPVASLVAFNFDASGYPGRKNIMVNVAGTLIPDDNTFPFAGNGNYFEFCRSSFNTQPKFQFKLSGTGTVITIPIVSQGTSTQRHVIKILGVNDASNNINPYGTEASIDFASFTALYNVSYWNSKNVTSVAASGMNLQITLTSALVNPIIWVEVLSTDPKLISLNNITIA